MAVLLCDTGSSIPAERLEQIFEPFLTTKAVSREVKCEFASQVGHVSVFMLYLPRVAAPVYLQKAAARSSSSNPTDCRLAGRTRLEHVVFQLLDRTHGGIRKPYFTGQQSSDRTLEQALVRCSQQGALRFGKMLQLGLEQDRDKTRHHGLLDFQHLDTGLQCFLFLCSHAVDFFSGHRPYPREAANSASSLSSRSLSNGLTRCSSNPAFKAAS